MRNVGLSVVIIFIGLVVVGAGISFWWIPRSELGGVVPLISAWCSALGIPRLARTNAAIIPPAVASDVVLDHALMKKPQKVDIGRGATLALRCSMCHKAYIPGYAGATALAGQYAAVIYKQLRDYKAGARSNGVMTPMAQSLSEEDIQQLAFYYASLPRAQASDRNQNAPAIVKWGAPMRNIPPCGSCHGALDHTMASPWLVGEPAFYIRSQLTAFASGNRQNDINGQMRAVARWLTAQEIDQAASFYGVGAQ